jgi:hypothetical protein
MRDNYMKQDIENIIKKNLPEKRTQDNLPFENSPEIYGNQRIEAYKNGFNQALSQINTSLIADEVIKVVVEYNRKQIELVINTYDITLPPEFIRNLTTLSPNKENENK